ncbi:MAG: helix-turn-helix domain-containing protein [Muribaculaceae bacterium]|nr:helix-turn-helix domain-containing protein [Muribaculaceae bacterium]
MKCGNLIKQRRAVLGLTQQDLSDYTGLSLRIIKSIEADKGNPSMSTLEKIADVLGLEIVIKVKGTSIDSII